MLINFFIYIKIKCLIISLRLKINITFIIIWYLDMSYTIDLSTELIVFFRNSVYMVEIICFWGWAFLLMALIKSIWSRQWLRYLHLRWVSSPKTLISEFKFPENNKAHLWHNLFKAKLNIDPKIEVSFQPDINPFLMLSSKE